MPVRPTLGARLGFAWGAVWVLVWTMIFSPCVVIHSALVPGAKTFKLWAGLWGRIILFGMGVRWRAEDRARLTPGQPVVFAVNHQNSIDILVASAAIPYPFGFAAKAGLRKLPFIGWVLGRTACIFVDRSTPRRAAESLVEAAERIRHGDAVLLYPEGGRSFSSTLDPFQRGAFVLAVKAGVPLVPVALVGDHALLDERRGLFRPGRVRVVIGEPIMMEGRRAADVPALMEGVRVWMQHEIDRGPVPAADAPAAPPPALRAPTEAPAIAPAEGSGEAPSAPPAAPADA